jgi:hypothetical protein
MSFFYGSTFNHFKISWYGSQSLRFWQASVTAVIRLCEVQVRYGLRV